MTPRSEADSRAPAVTGAPTEGGGAHGAVPTTPVRRTRRAGDAVVGGPDTRAGEYLGEVLTRLVSRMRETAAWFTETHEAGALHQLRISVRTSRALATFMDPITHGDQALRGANVQLRTVAAPFGEVRDLDVLMAAVDEGVAPVVLADRGLLRESLARRRAEAAEETEEHLASEEWRQGLETLERAAHEGEWCSGVAAREPAKHVVAHGLDAWWWLLTARWANLVNLDDRKRHRLRITAKKMRYMTELTSGLWLTGVAAQQRARATSRFKALQDHLGELQDYVAAVEVIRAHGFRATGADPAAVTAAMRGAVEVRDELEAAGPYWR